jgi:hypothetical protein
LALHVAPGQSSLLLQLLLHGAPGLPLMTADTANATSVTSSLAAQTPARSAVAMKNLDLSDMSMFILSQRAVLPLTLLHVW